MARYIFVAGGVMSGIGKGVATASIGKIIQSRGFKVTAIKIDPYVNVDAGTMNPIEHGEIFVPMMERNATRIWELRKIFRILI